MPNGPFPRISEGQQFSEGEQLVEVKDQFHEPFDR